MPERDADLAGLRGSRCERRVVHLGKEVVEHQHGGRRVGISGEGSQNETVLQID